MELRRRRQWLVVVVCAAIAVSVVPAPTGSAAPTQSAPPNTSPGVCDEYAGDPAAGTPEWQQRDANNVGCDYQRNLDAQTSPAFKAKAAQESALAVAEFAQHTAPDFAAEPNRVHANCCVNPLAKVADPFRNAEEWAASGRGQQMKFWFINRDGAKLRARLFAPPAGLHGSRRYPALTFTPGLQSYNEVNLWFAEGMAEAGYVVLIIDPQGQGDSENCGHMPDGTQTTCPSTNQPNDTRSAIDFILSTPRQPYPWALGANAAGTPTYNPWWAMVDRAHLGIAGHSLGAIAVTPIGQEDPRVDAVISYDNLDATLHDELVPKIHAPSLYFGTDYAFPATGMPKSSNPDPAQHLGAFEQLKTAGVDTMAITTRASDHYEFGYQPHPADFPASRYGERVAFYYSLAWFDRYLKHNDTALDRITAMTFDDSSDQHSIGSGTYDPGKAAADPSNPFAGNVPYTIAGKRVANLLSFYYRSSYFLGGVNGNNLRARGCPASN